MQGLWLCPINFQWYPPRLIRYSRLTSNQAYGPKDRELIDKTHGSINKVRWNRTRNRLNLGSPSSVIVTKHNHPTFIATEEKAAPPPGYGQGESFSLGLLLRTDQANPSPDSHSGPVSAASRSNRHWSSGCQPCFNLALRAAHCRCICLDHARTSSGHRSSSRVRTHHICLSPGRSFRQSFDGEQSSRRGCHEAQSSEGGASSGETIAGRGLQERHLTNV